VNQNVIWKKLKIKILKMYFNGEIDIPQTNLHFFFILNRFNKLYFLKKSNLFRFLHLKITIKTLALCDHPSN
jgi:hypothetical protein